MGGWRAWRESLCRHQKESPRYGDSCREALTGFKQDQIFILGFVWSMVGGRQTF